VKIKKNPAEVIFVAKFNADGIILRAYIMLPPIVRWTLTVLTSIFDL